ncbi:MAG TPA: hypothetical protein VFZ53_30450, partial [Polyangiaceae bacterium]
RPVSVVELRPEIPSGLSKAIERCMAREREARYPDIVSLARELAVYGTERGRRALTVIEAVASGQDDALPGTPPAVLASGLGATTLRPGLDTGTLSAAADSTPRSAAAPRLGPRARATIFVATLLFIGGAVAYVNTRRTSEAPLPSAAMSNTATAPSVSLPAPHVSAPPAVVVSPLPAASSVSPQASTKSRTRPLRVPSAVPPATGRGFDPVFDERR